MLEQFWQYGILAAVLIFGIKIGLSMGFAGIKRSTALKILIGYAIGLTALSYLCQPFTKQLNTLVYGYSSAIFSVIAVVILITGLKTVYDWKVTGKDSGTSTCMAMIAPCPCCFGAILSSVILIAPLAGVSTIALGSLSSVALVIIMGLTYYFSSIIVKKINSPYPIVLGNFMIFIGMYFLLCITILPNMGFISQATGIDINSIQNMIIILIGGMILVGIGSIMAQRNSYLLEH
ncbi:MAG: transporter [Methanosphaera stadtmanae]|nr:transporter [Methanosphaera stadtmanae]